MRNLAAFGAATVALLLFSASSCVGDNPATASIEPDASATGDTGAPVADTGQPTADSAPEAEAAAPPEPPTVVVSAVNDPSSIAVTADAIFAITPGFLLRFPSAGGKSFVVGESVTPAIAVGTPYLVSANRDEVYFLARSGTSIKHFRCSAAECVGKTPQEIPAVVNAMRGVMGDNEAMYAFSKSEISRCVGGTCTPVKCTSADSMRSMAAEGDRFAWSDTTDPGGTSACKNVDGGAPVRLHTTPGMVRLFQDVVYTLTVAQDTIVSCAATGCSGAAKPFVDKQTKVTSFVVGASGVYWTVPGTIDANGLATVADGKVLTCPLAGCPAEGPRKVAEGQASPTAIQIRNNRLYWANRGLASAASTGAIMRAGF